LRLWPLLACALFVGCATARAPEKAPERVSRKERVREILPHNVRVFVLEGKDPRRSASGVVVGSEATSHGAVSYVLTNAHVVDPADLKEPKLLVTVDGGPEPLEYAAQPLAVGEAPQMDLALLAVRGVLLPRAELADDSELELGEDVLVVSAPFGRPLSLSGGMVSQVDRDEQTRAPSLLKTDAPIGYGASGGGLYSVATGRLLAIVEGYRTAKVGFAVADQDYSFEVPMPGETFAAPSAKVRAFLKANGFERVLAASADGVAAR